jgi:hypothetical protein
MNKPFAKRFNGPRLTPEEAARQGQASTLAFRVLGKDAAIAFLNSHDEALNGRPIDLAIASAEGLALVEQALSERATAG